VAWEKSGNRGKVREGVILYMVSYCEYWSWHKKNVRKMSWNIMYFISYRYCCEGRCLI